MRKMYIWFIGLMSLIVVECFAQTKWTPETLPMVHLQDSTRYVCNPDGILSIGTLHEVDALLLALEQAKGVETVVVVVKSIEGDDPYEFGMQLSRKYGIGSKEQNSGLIVILCTEDRSYQILTGRGLEGTLPDAICRRVQNQVMIPLLKQGFWDSAILETMKTLDGIIRQDPTLKRMYDEEDVNPMVVVFIIAFLVLFVYSIYKTAQHINTRVCPKCQQKKLVKTGSSILRVKNSYFNRTKWRCKHCGHEEEHDEPTNDSNDSGMKGVPPTLNPFDYGRGRFGGLRGGGGGGFGGGFFGGGSFGGGGSGGRF